MAKRTVTAAEVLASDQDIMIDELSADGAPFSLLPAPMSPPPSEELDAARAAVARIASGEGQSWTVHAIAYSSLAVAHSDVLKACEQIRLYGSTEEGIDEAIKCANEAREGIDTAISLIQGKAWML